MLPASTAVTVNGAPVTLATNLTLTPVPNPPPPPTGPFDWPTYLGNDRRTSSNPNETKLAVSDATSLKVLWSASTGGVISDSTIVVGSTAYVGSWSGYLFAFNATTGQRIWKSGFLGQTSVCATLTGVAATPAYSAGTLYVGGGNARFYAVNASTGAIDWSLALGDPSKGYFLWASPLVVGDHAYQGVASACDQPLVPGSLDLIDLETPSVTAVFDTTLNGALGASIWASPAYASARDTVYVATGNPGNASGATYSESILALNASTLALEGQWQVPANETSTDGDFGATPSVFTGSNGQLYVAAPNKNGILYVWNASDLGAGPLWEHNLAVGYGPIIGGAAFGNGMLFVGTQRTLMNGGVVGGTVWAFNATTGKEAWEVVVWGGDLAAPAYSNGLVFVDGGDTFFALDAGTGAKLFHFSCGARFYAPPSVSRGAAYIGCSSGTEFAFGVPGTSSAETYSVTFGETGLPTGTSWSVVLGGTTKGSSTASLTFTEPNASYAFSVGGVPGTTPTPSSGSVTVDGAAVSVAISFAAGPPAVTSFSAVPASIDLGSSTVFEVSASGGAGTLSYAYSALAPGCSSADTAALPCTPTSAGTFTTEVEVTDSLGRAAFANASLTVASGGGGALGVAAPSISPNPSNVGTPTAFSLVASGGSPPYKYSWHEYVSGIPNPGDVAEFTGTPTSRGTWSISCTVTDATGASVTSSVTSLVVYAASSATHSSTGPTGGPSGAPLLTPPPLSVPAQRPMIARSR